jgi:hypothetical protein
VGKIAAVEGFIDERAFGFASYNAVADSQKWLSHCRCASGAHFIIPKDKLALDI